MKFVAQHKGEARYRMDAIWVYPALTGTAARLRYNPEDTAAATGEEVEKRRGITVYDCFSEPQLALDRHIELTSNPMDPIYIEQLYRGLRPDFAIAQ